MLDLDGLSLLSPPRGILAGGVGLARAWLGRLREAQGGRRLDLSSLGLDGAGAGAPPALPAREAAARLAHAVLCARSGGANWNADALVTARWRRRRRGQVGRRS